MENIKTYTQQKVAISELESPSIPLQSIMPEYQVKNKNLQSVDNLKNLESIQMETLSKSMILDLDLISKEKVLKPFWNEQLKEKYSTLWFPTKTDLQESVSISLNGLLNTQVDQSKSLIKELKQNNLTMTTSLVSLQSFVTHTTAKEQIVTKKIRIYPNEVSKWISLCDLSRYAYNAMIAYKKDYIKYNEKSSVYRKIITDNAKEWINYVNHVIQEACRDADQTASAIIKKRKNGQKSDFNFRSRKNYRQSFDIQKLPKNGIYPKYLGDNTYYTENIPEYAIGKSAKVIFEYGEWYLCCQDLINIEKQNINDKSRVVALDPGGRKFLIGYDLNKIITIGDKFQEKRLLPLLIKLDELYSLRSKLPKISIDSSQWIKDRYRYCEKRINKIRSKIKHLKDDLHKQSAFFLIKNYDVILLPTFEISEMVTTLNSKATRKLLTLNHYEFKLYLRWLCKKYGKTLIDVNESYTSKTNPFTGELMNLGGKEEFKYDGNVYDRDVNGARNIFIKNLIR